MGSIDDVSWQVLTVLLTGVGLAVSCALWRRRGAAAGLRGVAVSLLPVAALLTGTWRLVWEIGDAIGSWAVRFVFSPVVWLGVAVAGMSAILFAVGTAMHKRGAGAHEPAGRSHKRRGQGEPARASGAGRPVAKAAVDDDLAEIEAILKKRGIS